jgi:preprotein translocase subunit YajC
MTLSGFNFLLAQTTVPDQTGAQIKFVGMMAIVFVIMWFLMIAPQRKKAKEQELLIKALRAGDKVVTNSGILGVVLSIKDKTVTLRSAETKLEILKSAIADVTERGGEATEPKA